MWGQLVCTFSNWWDIVMINKVLEPTNHVVVKNGETLSIASEWPLLQRFTWLRWTLDPTVSWIFGFWTGWLDKGQLVGWTSNMKTSPWALKSFFPTSIKLNRVYSNPNLQLRGDKGFVYRQNVPLRNEVSSRWWPGDLWLRELKHYITQKKTEAN